MSNLETWLAFTLRPDIEGGYQCIRNDGGNWTLGRFGRGRLVGTNHGISAPLLMAWLGRTPSVEDMMNIPPQAVRGIYDREFAAPLLLEALPAPSALIFDMAVQHGPHLTVQLVQRLVGMRQDGRMGPITASAVAKYHGDFTADMEHAFLEMLATLGREWEEFGQDWRRRSTLRLTHARTLQPESPPTPTPAPQNEPVA